MTRVRALSMTELRLFLREPVTVLFTLALPLMVLYVLNGVFGQDQATGDPDALVVYRGFAAPDWYTPAYVAMAVAGFALIALPAHVVEYHESGVLRRFQASGLPKTTVLLSQAIVAMVVAAVGCGLLVAAALAFTGANPPQSLGLMVAAFLVSAAAITAVGLMLGVLLPTARAAQSVGLLAWFVSLFVSGGGPPPEVLPEGLRTRGRLVAAHAGHPHPAGALAHRRVGHARLARDARHRCRRARGGVACLPVGLSGDPDRRLRRHDVVAQRPRRQQHLGAVQGDSRSCRSSSRPPSRRAGRSAARRAGRCRATRVPRPRAVRGAAAGPGGRAPASSPGSSSCAATA